MQNQDLHFNVINSNDLQVLAQICAKTMQLSPLSDPLTNEEIVVMNLGMRSFLSQEIAHHNKIAAQCNYRQVWQFIYKIYGIVNNIGDKTSRFDRDFMTWNIVGLSRIWGQEDKVGFEKLREYIKNDEDGIRCYELAFKIADTLDQYEMYRPDWITTFNTFTKEDFDFYDANPQAEGKIQHFIKEASRNDNELKAKGIAEVIRSNLWQIRLWCSLRSNFDLKDENGNPLKEYLKENALLDRSEIMLRLSERLRSDKEIKGLPQRVFIFGVSSLPPQVIDFFKALSCKVDVYLMLLNPCAEYWGDIDSSWKSSFNTYKKRILATTKKNYPHLDKVWYQIQNKQDIDELDYDEEGTLIEGNPLLLSLGKQGRDNLALLLGTDPVPTFINAFVPNEKRTVLEKIQNHLLTLSVPNEPEIIDDGDTSFSIHACHTRQREVEVLRDAILSKFKEAADNKEKLLPRDFVVMVPKINDYAPYINAVFGSVSSDDNAFLPFSISDRTLAQSSPLASAVLTLLNIGSERITNILLIDLLSIPSIGERFEINADDVNLISKWLSDNSVYWGLDNEDTKEESQIELAGTFDKGLQRMIKGTLLGTEYSEYAEIEGSDSELLGRLFHFINELKKLRQIFTPSLQCEPEEWGTLLNTYILDKFFIQDSTFNSELKLLFETIDRTVTIVSSLKHKPKITLAVFYLMLKNALSVQPGFNPFLRDKINFCSLIPMRAIPFKHVFILGLNDLDFPREQRSPSFNLMGVRGLFRRGDRSAGLDDRFLFLEALISARKSIYFSYIGQSPIDRKELNPSSVLSELIDYVCDNFTVDLLMSDKKKRALAVKERLWCLEHMTSYHEENYVYSKTPGKLPHYPSFDKTSFVENNSTNQKRKYLGDKTLYPVQSESKQLLSYSELFSFLKNSSRYFLSNTLEINLNDSANEDLSDVETFVLSTIERGRILIDLSTLEDSEAKAYLANLREYGKLPNGVFGEIEQNNLIASIKNINAKLASLGLSQKQDICSFKNIVFNLNINKKDYIIELEGQESISPFILFPFHSFDNTLGHKVLLEAALKAAVLAVIGKGVTHFYLIDKNGKSRIFNGFTQAEGYECLAKFITTLILGREHPYPIIDKALKQKSIEDLKVKGTLESVITLNEEEGYVFGTTSNLFNNPLNAALLEDFHSFYRSNIMSRLD